MNVIAAAYFNFSHGDTVISDHLGTKHTHAHPPAYPHTAHPERRAAKAVIGSRQHLVLPVAPLPITSGEELRLFCLLELFELGGAA
jgi:hypothetical protein